MNNAIITVKNVNKIYCTNNITTHALNDVNLTINRNEVFGLLGVNGAGKTTLSSILATLHPPTSGSILFNGVSIYDDISHYRSALGFCPQNQNLDVHLTVQENLIFAGRYFLLPENLIKERTKKLLHQFNLTKYAHFNVNDLSGGTRQRLLIARALIHEPKVLILDEPTVGLDPDIRRTLWDIITQLKTMGLTVILTTHYLDEAEALSDRICVLNKGKVLLIESLKSLKDRHQQATLENIFLELTKNADEHI